ncbi:LacI family DNA-binding transcriptional regulator [Halocynthiibacter sp. C4]|uniref:LacI family DNA-binding transcriptional regulator n=1 Tax=Halocynthiibacter sp. C4 TaxID=2992758 RepID=UPI00237A44B9|nr:LacI family DNA-binding transcriptional regulator [Halocynthiibacter sp. C4]MDE0589695.1 LacI family DNA-binding transcriptional regulator [Halocynthiibacter sp. C4]
MMCGIKKPFEWVLMIRKRKSTIAEIAKEAGVSKATVDRVLNDRGAVQPQTRAIVMEAVRRIESPSLVSVDKPTSICIDQSKISFTVLVPGIESGFFNSITDELNASPHLSKIDLMIAKVPGVSAEDFANAIDKVDSSYLAIVAIDHPLVRRACSRFVKNGGKLITFLSRVSDIPCLGHVGVDNRAEGRLAAWFAQLLLGRESGEIAFLHGQSAFQSQEQRELGFRSAIQDSGSLWITAAFDADKTGSVGVAASVENLLATNPELSILYNMSIRNREVAEAIERSGRPVILIGHDLTEVTKQMLLEGKMAVVLDQNIALQVECLLSGVIADHSGIGWTDKLIETRFYCRENLPI